MKIDNSINLKWMRRAIDLALLGNGRTSPNPLVGAVIVDKNGELIAEGFHLKAGLPHAEAMAFDNLKKNPEGGSLYVNLEPCCHEGKTPPCVKRIISSGLKRVFVSIQDPDSRVAGKGLDQLKKAGIEVNLGLCKEQAISINRSFIHRNLTGQSYGVLKWAMSMDGRIGLKNGKSQWITDDYSRALVHATRADFDAIIVGGNTLRKDNPLLTTRGIKTPEPLRVVFTKTLDLPIHSNLWDTQLSNTLVIYDASSANEEHLKKIPKNIELEKVSSDDPKLVSKILAQKGHNKILWECGPKLATSAIKAGCIQELITFVAPKILGGDNCMTPFSDFEFTSMKEVINLNLKELNLIGDDIRIFSDLKLKN